jgi:signal transduction histidine kinase
MTSRSGVNRQQRAHRREIGAVVLYLAAVAILLAEARVPGARGDTRPQDAWAVVLVGVATAVLLVRRRWPVAVAVAVVGIAYLWWFGADYDSRAINIPYLVALYTVAVTGHPRRTVAVGCLIAAGHAVAFLPTGEGLAIQRWFTGLGWTVAALLFGETMRSRSELLEAAGQRASRAEAESDRRLAEERLRIARDLHDVLAHTVSVMSVQAEVASDALERDPAVARTALRTIRRAARDAMDEVRATVAVLRGTHERAANPPAPRIDRIGDVVQLAREQGLDVGLDVQVRQQLPDVVELTAYRVVQEAITNVLRHADARSAIVRVHEEPRQLMMEVRDDGRRHNGQVSPGFGLRGMAERVESLGGQVWHGYDGEQGWAVRALIPLREDAR